jgi:hypothetical protein
MNGLLLIIALACSAVIGAGAASAGEAVLDTRAS